VVVEEVDDGNDETWALLKEPPEVEVEVDEGTWALKDPFVVLATGRKVLGDSMMVEVVEDSENLVEDMVHIDMEQHR
jgi:hypothetical protein